MAGVVVTGTVVVTRQPQFAPDAVNGSSEIPLAATLSTAVPVVTRAMMGAAAGGASVGTATGCACSTPSAALAPVPRPGTRPLKPDAIVRPVPSVTPAQNGGQRATAPHDRSAG